MNAATEDRQIKSNLVVFQNTLIIDLNQNFIFADREIHVYLIRENFVGVKCQIFLEIFLGSGLKIHNLHERCQSYLYVPNLMFYYVKCVKLSFAIYLF